MPRGEDRRGDRRAGPRGRSRRRIRRRRVERRRIRAAVTTARRPDAEVDVDVASWSGTWGGRGGRRRRRYGRCGCGCRGRSWGPTAETTAASAGRGERRTILFQHPFQFSAAVAVVRRATDQEGPLRRRAGVQHPADDVRRRGGTALGVRGADVLLTLRQRRWDREERRDAPGGRGEGQLGQLLHLPSQAREDRVREQQRREQWRRRPGEEEGQGAVGPAIRAAGVLHGGDGLRGRSERFREGGERNSGKLDEGRRRHTGRRKQRGAHRRRDGGGGRRPRRHRQWRRRRCERPRRTTSIVAFVFCVVFVVVVVVVVAGVPGEGSDGETVVVPVLVVAAEGGARAVRVLVARVLQRVLGARQAAIGAAGERGGGGRPPRG